MNEKLKIIINEKTRNCKLKEKMRTKKPKGKRKHKIY